MVVVAEDHLRARAAVEVQHGGIPLVAPVARGKKELPVNRQPTRRREGHLLRLHECRRRKARRRQPRRERAAVGGARGTGADVAQAHELHLRRYARGRGLERERCAVRRNHRPVLDSRSRRHQPGRGRGDRYAPEMPPVDVALIGRVHQLATVRREDHVLHLVLARRQIGHRSTARRNRVQMHPARALPGKRDAVAVPPKELALGVHESPEGAAHPWARAPHLTPLACLRVGDADRPGLRLALRPRAGLGRLRDDTNEGESSSVRRPDGLLITVGTRIEIEKRACAGIEHADEAVLIAQAHEGQAVAVR